MFAPLWNIFIVNQPRQNVKPFFKKVFEKTYLKTAQTLVAVRFIGYNNFRKLIFPTIKRKNRKESKQMFDSKNNRVCELRLENKMTQKELANALNIQRSLLARIETGQRSLTLEKAWKIADYFHVSIDYLVGRIDYK